jgi:hypothetical protein
MLRLAEDDSLAAAALAAIRGGDVERLARLFRDEPGASTLMLQHRRRCTVGRAHAARRRATKRACGAGSVAGERPGNRDRRPLNACPTAPGKRERNF